MSDYIKREDAIKAFDPLQRQDWYTPWIVETLEDLPSADVEPVVRCKDCKWKADTIGESWCDFHEFTILADDDYCSHGERKDNG